LNDLAVRYKGDSSAVVSAIRQAIRDVDRNLPISNVTTMEEQVADSMPNQRIIAQLSAFFGMVAVFLSCIGIFGLMSYVVTRRTNEIGIRMALGGNRTGILWLVMREGLLLVVIGIGAGIPLAVVGGRLVSSMLFGVRAVDALSLSAAIALLALVAVLAGYLPARRASLVEPMAALRHE